LLVHEAQQRLPEMLRAAVPDHAVKLYSVLPMQAVLGIA